MGYLTTHILDTTKGIAAAGVKIHLYKHTADGQRQRIHSTLSNNDGRCDQPLLQADDFSVGVYELEFAIDEYFNASDLRSDGETTTPNFLNTVVIRFGISDENAHYHIPLLVSPYSYSTYRGS
ncbi:MULTISPECIES: hydroxyisourate hydrolase [Marinomonas]|uniref:5-hydroxyisourate hydrolase n=1 Tax=Marinomonas arctica TaxID=383750 RepID=A0A7H1J215_9GAMM|nr:MULTISPECIES: hydroxyisourate hydrolase [Marinomonas]MCS7488223.1 5-hydroxyisourate hydrolase [Marinomonas sp. BSi20414]QNT04531.1 hydroxyisourate hydrolase [Marinomonas arctica]GGN36949.1 5-hydroxyisourate hydrolase [Marinomonas arctica]